MLRLILCTLAACNIIAITGTKALAQDAPADAPSENQLSAPQPDQELAPSLQAEPQVLGSDSAFQSSDGNLALSEDVTQTEATGTPMLQAPANDMSLMTGATDLPVMTQDQDPNATPTLPPLAPPIGGRNDANSALPDAGAIEARSPGLALPTDAGLAAPAAPGTGTQPQKSKEEIQAEIRDEAFAAALTGLLPLEPPEIRKLIERFDRTQEAVETPIYPFPTPEIVVKNVPLDPGSQPLEIKVATHHVTTLNIVDASGSPWPVRDITWAGNFEIIQPEAGGHVLRITPLSDHAYGNMSVRLLGLNTPVTFMIRTHRDFVHYRFDATIPVDGPNAKPPIIAVNSGPKIAAGDKVLTSILDGVPTQDARRMEVSGVDGRTTAYQVGEQVYVRTPLSLLSPAWDSSAKSADGMNVYTLQNAPVLLLSDNGRMIRARISEKAVEQ